MHNFIIDESDFCFPCNVIPSKMFSVVCVVVFLPFCGTEVAAATLVALSSGESSSLNLARSLLSDSAGVLSAITDVWMCAFGQVNDFIRDKLSSSDGVVPHWGEIIAGGCVSYNSWSFAVQVWLMLDVYDLKPILTRLVCLSFSVTSCSKSVFPMLALHTQVVQLIVSVIWDIFVQVGEK